VNELLIFFVLVFVLIHENNTGLRVQKTWVVCVWEPYCTWDHGYSVAYLCLGVGGNLVAVQASRLSTALHRVSIPGRLPEDAVHGCPSPVSTFFSKSTLSFPVVRSWHVVWDVILYSVIMHNCVVSRSVVTVVVLVVLDSAGVNSSSSSNTVKHYIFAAS